MRVHGHTLGLEQALVGRVKHQGVLEQIGCLRRRAPPEHQLGLDQPPHRVVQCRLRQPRERSDGRVIEGAANHGRGLRHLLDRVQPVKPGHQRVVQAGRDGEPAERAGELVRGGCLEHRPRFQHRLGHLLDEQRHAVAAGGDLVEQRTRQRLAGRDPLDDELHRAARQPVQDKARHDRMAGE